MAAAMRFGRQLRELRVHLCQKGGSSAGVREFIDKYYVGIKKENPTMPILVRECSGVQPKMYARYEYGREASVPLDNISAEDVLERMKQLSQAT